MGRNPVVLTGIFRQRPTGVAGLIYTPILASGLQ